MDEEKASGKKIRRDILKWVAICLGGAAFAILIFGVGMMVGETKAKFSYRWAESYHKNFAGPRGGFFGDWQRIPPRPGDFIEGHGAFGTIIKIDKDALIVKGQDEIEKTVLVKEDTAVARFRDKIQPADLKIDDFIVVIGQPNEAGQIVAKLIRVMPPSPSGGLQPPAGRRSPLNWFK